MEPFTTIAGKYALTKGTKRGGGGGVNVGQSLSPPSHFILATGLNKKVHIDKFISATIFLKGLAKLRLHYGRSEKQAFRSVNNFG